MSTQSIRLDKWLWAARFYKTRSQATEAIKGGKVHINGSRIKPSKIAETGQIVSINKASQRFEIEIIALSDRRGNFSIAQTLYQETQESIARREKETELRKLANSARLDSNRRPTKRDRRKIINFTHREDKFNTE